MADVYLHGHHASVLASHGARTAADSAAYLLPHLRAGMQVLDVGCGPGTVTLDLAEAVGASGAVVGVENVVGPLEQARRNAVARGDQRTRFELADVMGLPYAAASFDVVHATRCSSTSPTPSARSARWHAWPGPVDSSRCATSTTPRWCGTRPLTA